MSHPKRLQKLRALLRRHKVDGLLVTLDSELLITDPRYTTQLEEECPGLALKVRQPGERMLPTTAAAIKSAGADRLAIESDSLTVGTHAKLAEELGDVEIVPKDGLVESLRMIKDRGEVDEIRLAADQARRALDVVRAAWTPDATEKDLARELEYQARRFGGKGLSFPAIVASGPRAALPHATPTDARVGDEAFTLIDWGVYAHLYASDLTRMVVTQPPTKKFEKVYNTVLAAQEAAIEAIAPGKQCQEVDAVARGIITKAGYGPKFGHGLGHGLGLEVHEAPSLGRLQETELKPGMVVTVEPGIYLPGWGGVRIEDDVLVTKTGYEVLSDVPKSLESSVL